MWADCNLVAFYSYRLVVHDSPSFERSGTQEVMCGVVWSIVHQFHSRSCYICHVNHVCQSAVFLVYLYLAFCSQSRYRLELKSQFTIDEGSCSGWSNFISKSRGDRCLLLLRIFFFLFFLVRFAVNVLVRREVSFACREYDSRCCHDA